MEIDFLNFFNAVPFIKIITLIIIAFYAIFTFVILTQVRVMNQIVFLPAAAMILQTIAIINLLIAISLFLAALVIL